MDADDDVGRYGGSSEDEIDDARHSSMLASLQRALGDTKRPVLGARSEVLPMSSALEGAVAGKVTVDQLLVAQKKSAKSNDLRKTLKISELRQKDSKIKPPEAKHVHDKARREVAFKDTKREVDKWQPIVEGNKKAEHISFAPNAPKPVTVNQWIGSGKPRTPMEMEIASLLKGSKQAQEYERSRKKKVNEGDVLTFEQEDHAAKRTDREEREAAAMSLTEAKEMHKELQRLRAREAYAAVKAKRTHKIKSKKYHRLLRKSELKKEKKEMEKLAESNPDEVQAKAEEADKQRMMERMSLKHRGGSKYAKRQMIFAKYDPKARQQVADMKNKSRELTRKSRPEPDEEDEDEEMEGDDGDSDQENGEEAQTLFNPWLVAGKGKKKSGGGTKSKDAPIGGYRKPVAVSASVEETVGGSDSEEEKSVPLTGVESMAVEREEVESDYDENDSDEDIPNDVDLVSPADESPAEADEPETRHQNGEEVNNKDTDKQPVIADESSDSDSDFEVDEVEEIFSQMQETKKKKAARAAELASISQIETERKRADRKRKRDREPPTGNKRSNSTNISEALSRKQTLQDFEDVLDDDEGPTTLAEAAQQLKAAEEVRNQVLEQEQQEEETVEVSPVSQSKADQRVSLAEAFADDDVVAEFAQEKQGAVERGAPRAEDLTLPGWGDWTGGGLVVSKKKRKRFRKPAPAAPPRKDSKMEHVIINEKAEESVRKHQVKEVPFPFTNVTDYEAYMKQPIGRDWIPETAFRKKVRPRVTVRPGQVIEPIDKTVAFTKQQQMLDKKKGKGGRRGDRKKMGVQ